MSYVLWSYILYIMCTFCACRCVETVISAPMQQMETFKDVKEEKPVKVPFSYVNEDIVNIINSLEGLLKKGVLLPQGANALNVKLTYTSTVEYTPEEAWDLLLSFLDMAGYSVIEKSCFYQIIKSNREIAREGLPVYISTGINDARDADQRIMYVHYFTNMKALGENAGEVQEILKTMLPDDAKYVMDQNKNALIIAARAHDIYNVIDIMNHLDQSDFKEKIDFIPLHHASARIVADLFNEHFLVQEDPATRYRLDTRKKAENSYFAPHTRIIAYEPNNSLIVIGSGQGIARVKEFIVHYIDTEPDSGQSILHVYRLQYLDAEEFAPVLQKIVEPGASSTGQSRGESKRPTGPERFFDEVIVAVDKPRNAQELKYYGGNNLVIACRNDDWKVIEDLIADLDTPQDQVFIEILIADLTLNDSRKLGSLMRNPNAFPLFNQIAFQSAQLAPGVIVQPLPVDTTSNVNGNLLPAIPDTCAGSAACSPTIAAMVPGSAAISFNDNNGNTWNITQLLKLFSHSKIISHPHVIATHNKETQFAIGEYRLVQGDVTGSIGSNTVVKQEPITADLKIFVTPRISGANTVNLDIKIDIENFIPGTSNAKMTRSVKTNANVLSESILALGGLIRTQSTQSKGDTPILGDIPILGYFFKSRSGDLRKNNLTAFICPTIVHSRLRKGMGTITRDYVYLAEQYSAESVLFDTIKDPITRMFFQTTEDAYAQELQSFVELDEFIEQETIAPPVSAQDVYGEEAADAQELVSSSPTVQDAAGRTTIARARRIRKRKKSTGAPPATSIATDSDKHLYAQLKKQLQHDDASPFDAKEVVQG
jgi:general secretion pathway protein D